MSTIEQKAATEVLKPASGFVSAALKPWIKRVEKWAKNKELKEELQPEKLTKNLDNYLTCLANQVSKMTSIIFPQQHLSMDSEYEPLRLIKGGQFVRTVEEFDLLDAILKPQNTSRNYTIIDGAGMGKSTYAKFLVGQLLFKSDRIPVFLELRNMDADLSMAENIAKQLDVPGYPFPREVFYRLLLDGSFALILDGFDEVAIAMQSGLAQKIAAFAAKNPKNILVLTSRKQPLLPDLVDNVTLSFSQLNIEQVRSLCNRFDKFSCLDIGVRLMKEIESVPNKFLKTPLLVSLVYQTFGVNNSISDGISTFYADVYNALYKGHDLINKSGFEREKRSNLDFISFQRLLGAFSFYFLSKKDVKVLDKTGAIILIEKARTKVGIDSKISGDFLEDLLSAVPLMIEEGREIKFLHRTIAEYFAALYLVSNSRSVELMERIYNSGSKYAFDKVFEFVLELNPDLFDEVITKIYAEHMIQYPLNSVEERILSSLCFEFRMYIGISINCNIDELITLVMHQFNFEGFTYYAKEDCLLDEKDAVMLFGREDYVLFEHVSLAKKRLSDEFLHEVSDDEIAYLKDWPITYEIGKGYQLTKQNIPDFANFIKSSNLSFGKRRFFGRHIVSKQKCEHLLKRIENAKQLESDFDDLL